MCFGIKLLDMRKTAVNFLIFLSSPEVLSGQNALHIIVDTHFCSAPLSFAHRKVILQTLGELHYIRELTMLPHDVQK